MQPMLHEMDGDKQTRESAGGPTVAVLADDQHPTPPSQLRDRKDFEIAIICALPLEASAVSALIDKQWDDQRYGNAPRDSNAYSTGVIGRHNVVLVHMPNIGK